MPIRGDYADELDALIVRVITVLKKNASTYAKENEGGDPNVENMVYQEGINTFISRLLLSAINTGG